MRSPAPQLCNITTKQVKVMLLCSLYCSCNFLWAIHNMPSAFHWYAAVWLSLALMLCASLDEILCCCWWYVITSLLWFFIGTTKLINSLILKVVYVFAFFWLSKQMKIANTGHPHCLKLSSPRFVIWNENSRDQVLQTNIVAFCFSSFPCTCSNVWISLKFVYMTSLPGDPSYNFS